jgi:SAM-dependent methyltransferase
MAKAKAKTKDKDKAKKKRKKKQTEAQKADVHALYQQSVQTPDADVWFFNRVFKKIRGRKPMSLREDFCGTAFLSTTWVKSHAERSAVGIDIDGSVIAWGREHNVAPLDRRAADRVSLHVADVLDGVGDRCDVACAMNFSYCVFKERHLLRRYFEVVRERLVEDGLFICELYGGFEAICEIEEERECEGFTYIWEQKTFNPIDHHTLCHIHYEFEDGSKLKRAFTYDWRLWTIPEIRELLLDAGFSGVKVYWETMDDDGEGTGEFHESVEEENQDSWLVYIVGVR